jgi:2-polyprenyl-6-methoxyphenol hydroxylase-like FAD-dependent oxidoreductase
MAVASPAGRIAFCLDDWVLPGYGWVFPLPDGRANVGVGTLVKDGADREHLRELYVRFTEDPRSPAAPWLHGSTEDGSPRSWPLDLGPRERSLALDGLLVAGEAAALVGPLTGAGIAFALASGKAAGEAAATALSAGDVSLGALSGYERAIRRRFGLWLRAEAAAQRWLSDPVHVRRMIRVVQPLPPTGAVGARLLLHSGDGNDVRGSGFGVRGSGFRGSGFGVSGFGVRVRVRGMIAWAAVTGRPWLWSDLEAAAETVVHLSHL